MASIQKTEAGTWRVQIERRGRREFKTLPTKALAVAWANQREAELAQGLVASVDVAQRTAFAEVIEHYRNGELKKKRNRGYPPILNTLDKLVRNPRDVRVSLIGGQALCAERKVTTHSASGVILV